MQEPASVFAVSFIAGNHGTWCIERISAVVGEGLPLADRLDVVEDLPCPTGRDSRWSLRGVTSNVRYTTRAEATSLAQRTHALPHAEATRAALIPIRKNEAWWKLAQDERRAIFEERSHHIEIGSEYLPAIARRLYHSRDVREPFDFLTWFQYAPEQSDAFEVLVRRLRESTEWRYVDREVDIRLTRV